MSKIHMIAIIVLVFCLFSFITTCKIEQVEGEYLLTVAIKEGVVGEPGAGLHSYPEGQVVNYSFQLSTGYTNLRIKLDGEVMAASGSIKMTQNHTLTAECDPINYSGTWKLTYNWTSGNCGLTGGINEDVTITHNGKDISLLIPKEGLLFVGEIKADGSFAIFCEDQIDSDTVILYQVAGKMTGEATLEAVIAAAGYYKGAKSCTSSGSVTGKRD